MTTISGAIRSYNAAVHRAERTHQRKVKEAARIYQQQKKARAAADAISAVRDQGHYLEVLVSVHKDCSDPVSWEALRDEQPPVQPAYIRAGEERALQMLRSFRPNLLHKLFGKERKLRSLEMGVIKAQQKDKNEHLGRMEDFGNKRTNWEKVHLIAEGVCHRNPETYREAIAFFGPFEEIVAFGSSITFLLQADHATIELYVNDEEIVPKEALTTTQTGKLSRKNMPVSRYHKLYQDHICSSVLRVAREVTALLPLDKFVVNASHKAVNTSTGKIEQRYILSVAFHPTQLDRLNFDALNPADAMANFTHRMRYAASAGMLGIDPLDINILIENKA